MTTNKSHYVKVTVHIDCCLFSTIVYLRQIERDHFYCFQLVNLLIKVDDNSTRF